VLSECAKVTSVYNTVTVLQFSRRNIREQKVHHSNESTHEQNFNENAIAGDRGGAPALACRLVLEQHGHILDLVAEAHRVLHVLVLNSQDTPNEGANDRQANEQR